MGLFDGLKFDEDLIRHVPRSGNPIIDAGIQIGGRMLLRASAQANDPENLEYSPYERPVDPRQGLRTIISKIIRTPHGIYLVNGPRGTGKTSFSLYLAQEMKRPTFAINMGRTLPWIESIEAKDIEVMPERSVCIVDDSGLVFGSRDYHSAVAGILHELIILARHKEIVIIANTQATSLIDKYLMDCDAFFLKRPSMLTIEIERQGLKTLLKEAQKEFDGLMMTPELERGFIYCFSDPFRFKGLIGYPMPSGYSDSISRNKS